MSDRETGKYISLILRPKPEVISISLDEHGWANVDELICWGKQVASSGYGDLRANSC